MNAGLSGALREASATLAAAGVASPRADAVALAGHLLGVDAGEVERRAILGAPAPDGLTDLVAERARRVPLQHLTGVAHFRRLTLRVGPGVFTPRPETELLVDLALAVLADTEVESHAAAGEGPVVVDLCTGSGAIAFAIASEHPGARVHAAELSPEAYAWARLNADALGLDLDLTCTDAAEAFPQLAGGVDLVTCNPPYIPADAVPVDPEVAEHDPELALYGGPGDGLDVPRRMAAHAATLLRPGGWLLMEHADCQRDGIVAALREAGWVDVADHDDLTGRPRVVVARRG